MLESDIHRSVINMLINDMVLFADDENIEGWIDNYLAEFYAIHFPSLQSFKDYVTAMTRKIIMCYACFPRSVIIRSIISDLLSYTQNMYIDMFITELLGYADNNVKT